MTRTTTLKAALCRKRPAPLFPLPVVALKSGLPRPHLCLTCVLLTYTQLPALLPWGPFSLPVTDALSLTSAVINYADAKLNELLTVYAGEPCFSHYSKFNLTPPTCVQ